MKDLKYKLESTFKPLGIVAFTNCCRIGCTGTYEEDDDFQFDELNGNIFFFNLSLDGMNYKQHVFVQYRNHSFVVQNSRFGKS